MSMKYDVAIIGVGPAGYTAAESAARKGLSVVFFGKKQVGGVCLNEGCIPTKTLLYAVKLAENAGNSSKYGVQIPEVSYGLPKMIARKNRVVRKLVLGIKARLTAAGVNLVEGEAWIEDRHTIRCKDELYRFENLILCTGSHSFIPPIPGLDSVDYWIYREALENRTVPRSFTVIGGGVIGIEFASFYHTLGSEVTVIEMAGEILPGADPETAALLRREYERKGVKFLLNNQVLHVEKQKEQIVVLCREGRQEREVICDKLLVSTGRNGADTGSGLEKLSLKKNKKGYRVINSHMESSVKGVFLCGDLTGDCLLAHTAIWEAEVSVHTIVGKKDEMSYRAIPAIVYTNPELAGVGETENSLVKKGIPYIVSKLPMSYSGRFVAENEGFTGMCKLLIGFDDTLLGAHLIGNPASEIITLAGMAIENRLKVSE